MKPIRLIHRLEQLTPIKGKVHIGETVDMTPCSYEQDWVDILAPICTHKPLVDDDHRRYGSASDLSDVTCKNCIRIHKAWIDQAPRYECGDCGNCRKDGFKAFQYPEGDWDLECLDCGSVNVEEM